MSNATNISIARDDGTSITLVPVSSSTEGGVTEIVFRELSQVKPILACVRVTLLAEVLKSGVTKVTRKLEVPILEIIPAGAVNSDGRVASPAVSHVETDIRTRFHHPLSNATERADSMRMGSHLDCSGHATVNTYLGPGAPTANIFRDVLPGYQVPYSDINLVWPSA